MADLDVVDEGAVRFVYLSRPHAANALNLATLHRLRNVVEDTGSAPAIRCLVLSGRGRFFCAGADVKEWQAGPDAAPADLAREWGKTSKAMICGLADLSRPVVAAINGVTAGAGLDLACACDFRLAASSASFICSYTRVGFAPDAGGTWFLPRLIGLEAAKRLIFTGESWTAERALEAGLVGQVFEPDALMPAVRELAFQLAAGPTIAIGQAKRLLHGATRLGLAEQIEREHEAAAVCRATADHQEGLRAANEKRPPVFQGR
jgi:2-(1,2-epoxy-1,2-dihydrophenyl)acetyl-CoA isomerase